MSCAKKRSHVKDSTAPKEILSWQNSVESPSTLRVNYRLRRARLEYSATSLSGVPSATSPGVRQVFEKPFF